MKTNFVFNHDHQVFHQGLGIPDELSIKVREKILFTAFSSALTRVENYGWDIENSDCPKELSTITGDFQKLMQCINDEFELQVALLYFKNYQKIAIVAFSQYKEEQQLKEQALKEIDKTDNEKMKSVMHSIMHQISKLKQLAESKQEDNSDDDEDDDDASEYEKMQINKMNGKTLQKRIHLVKKSNYNFDKYMKLLTLWAEGGREEDAEGMQDITDLLNNILKRSDNDVDS